MKYDVLIIGAGIAGLYTALSLPSNLKALVLSKDEINNCNTYRAQGGIACVWDEDDDFEIHMEDSLKAGNGKNNKKMLEIMVSEGPENIQNLIDYGVDFDKNERGYDLTLEGGHTKRRILHYKDTTGKRVIEVLAQNAFKKNNIEINERTMAVDITKCRNGFLTTALDENEEPMYIESDFTVIASGGIGRLYKYTTNASIASGDGITLASKAGAKLKHMDLIQFHPTGLYENSGDRFLISESVRGEGGILRNNKKEAFMHLYHEMADLAPRDVVSKSMLNEMKNSNSNYLYLDVTAKPKEYLENRFPHIYKSCKNRKLSMEKDFIPVSPCQHYFMGGIEVDEFGSTTVENLYATGECACTEVHGNNRLASNSLLEALVFSKRVAKSIGGKHSRLGNKDKKSNTKVEARIHDDYDLKGLSYTEKKHLELSEIESLKNKVREIMQNSFFVNFNIDYAEKNIEFINELKSELNLYKNNNKNFYELVSLAEVSNIILKEKLKNARVSN